jgi:hypothetical protein
MRALTAIALVVTSSLLSACSSGDGASTAAPQTPAKVAVPAIVGDVPQDQFCKVYKEVTCAANVGCCGIADLKSPTVAKCMETAVCPSVLDDQLLKDGTLRYDAKLAGDFLREKAAAASSCGPHASSKISSFIVGTLPVGADCAPATSDGAHKLACSAGLRCATSVDDAGVVTGKCEAVTKPAPVAIGQACEAGSDCGSGRCADEKCAEPLKDGSACAADDDCASRTCSEAKCAPSANTWCTAATKPPPSNTDWTAPDKLCVTAASGKDYYGSTGDLTLIFKYQSPAGKKYWYECDITNTISAGEEECCVPRTVSESCTNCDKTGDGEFRISMQSSDGLQVTTVTVKKTISGVEQKNSSGTYDNNDGAVDMEGCDGWWIFGSSANCTRFWLATDSECNAVRINMNSDDIYCVDTN